MDVKEVGEAEENKPDTEEAPKSAKRKHEDGTGRLFKDLPAF